MAKTARIAVIGGGIGGLTAAQALLQKGFEVSVYEAAPELKEIGAGVALGPNAMKVMRHLGLEQKVRDVAFEGEYQTLRSWKGAIISRTPRDQSNRYGASGCSVHRADLLDVLATNLPGKVVQLAARCNGVENHGDTAVAKFTDGSQVEADVIIGADGIHSAVKDSLFGPDKPRFTGKICYRCLVPIDAVPGGFSRTDGATWLGPHGTVVVYLVRRGELINVVCHYDDDTWQEEVSWIRECDKQEVIDRYDGWHESLLRLFTASDKHYKWALHDRDPLRQWTKGRVTIMGDAAHSMLPYLGQGACQAMEDGVVLAAALDANRDDLAAGLKVYEKVRLPRANRVVLSARERGVDNHQPSALKRWKRDVMIALRRRLTPDRGGRGGEWIYSYDAGSPTVLTGAS